MIHRTRRIFQGGRRVSPLGLQLTYWLCKVVSHHMKKKCSINHLLLIITLELKMNKFHHFSFLKKVVNKGGNFR